MADVTKLKSWRGRDYPGAHVTQGLWEEGHWGQRRRCDDRSGVGEPRVQDAGGLRELTKATMWLLQETYSTINASVLPSDHQSCES